MLSFSSPPGAVRSAARTDRGLTPSGLALSSGSRLRLPVRRSMDLGLGGGRPRLVPASTPDPASVACSGRRRDAGRRPTRAHRGWRYGPALPPGPARLRVLLFPCCSQLPGAWGGDSQGAQARREAVAPGATSQGAAVCLSASGRMFPACTQTGPGNPEAPPTSWGLTVPSPQRPEPQPWGGDPLSSAPSCGHAPSALGCSRKASFNVTAL